MTEYSVRDDFLTCSYCEFYTSVCNCPLAFCSCLVLAYNAVCYKDRYLIKIDKERYLIRNATQMSIWGLLQDTKTEVEDGRHQLYISF